MQLEVQAMDFFLPSNCHTAYMATNDMLDAMRPEPQDLKHALQYTKNTPEEILLKKPIA